MKFMPKKKVEEKKEEQKEATPSPQRPSTETPAQPSPQPPSPQRPSTETPAQPSPQPPSPEKPVQNKPPTQVPPNIVQKPVQQRPQPRPEIKPPTQTIKKVGQEQATAPPTKQSTQQEMKANVDTDIIKKIIRALATSSENSINPVINFEKNQVSYPILSKIGEDELNIDLLEKLSSKTAGVLDKEIYERMVVCPQHPEDLSVSIRLYCPECSSIHVERLQLIEHKVCGYIAEMEEFGVTAVTDVTTCPHCKRQIKDASKEIRTPGRWNKCHECGNKFDNVIVKLFCRRYNHDFEIMEAATFPISYYKLRREADESVDIITLVPALKKIFSSRGFVVEEFASVKGKSGVAHQTSLYAHDNQNKTIVVFIKSSKKPIEDSEVNAIIVNVLDISPSRTILIAMPSVSERAKTMAASHGVSVVTGTEPNQITATIEQMLSKGLAVQANSG